MLSFGRINRKSITVEIFSQLIEQCIGQALTSKHSQITELGEFRVAERP